jgi:hypothetical protein
MALRTALVLTVSITIAAASQSTAQSPSLTAVMSEKAENAQRLVRQLVTDDFAGVDYFAERLARLTTTEIGSWQARPEPRYLEQANRFVDAVQQLRTASRDRDAGQAIAAYAKLLSSCAGCHRQVRASGSSTLTPPAPVITPPVPGLGP